MVKYHDNSAQHKVLPVGCQAELMGVETCGKPLSDILKKINLQTFFIRNKRVTPLSV